MKKLLYTALALAPNLAFAQQLEPVRTLLTSIRGLVTAAIPVVVGLALLAFFWGLMKFIFAQSDETAKADGKKIMVMGLIALFVMVSVWGLVGFIARSLGVENAQDGRVPTLQGLNN